MRNQGIIDKGAALITDLAQGSANAATTITVAADEGEFWVVRWIGYSFDGAITGTPTLAISYGGTDKIIVNISDRRGHIEFNPPLHHQQTLNEALVVTLGAGGAGVSGRLYLGYN